MEFAILSAEVAAAQSPVQQGECAEHSKRTDADREEDPESAAAVRDGLGAVNITLRAEIGESHMPVRRVLALKPGDVIGLGIPVDAAMDICADGVTLHRVRPGRHGRSRAIQIIGPAELEQ